MVGFHTIFSTRLQEFDTNELSFLKHEKWFELDVLCELPEYKLVFSNYEGYPYLYFENQQYAILMEGLVYNLEDNDLRLQLNKLAENFVNENYKLTLKHFVEKADGDYIIQVYDKHNKKCLIFNDYLGRLPIYYYCDDSLALISREIKTNLQFIPKIYLDQAGIVEYLIFGYTLGKRTIFKNIQRLSPSEGLLFKIQNGKIKVATFFITEFNFKTKNRFFIKKKSLRQLTDQLLKATELRVKKLLAHEFNLIVDLSGGYDTRAVIGALSKYNKMVSCFTHEYIQDESEIAMQVFKNLDRPGKYTKLAFKSTFDYKELSPLIYKTDGLVNFYTTAICYNDASYLKSCTPGKVARFGGFGGELIRHPEKRHSISIMHGIENLLYSSLNLIDIVKLLNLDYIFLKKKMAEYFESYPENRTTEKLKRFYYEYYRHMVGLAGEERSRIFHWMVMPLWSKEFMKIIFHRIPLKWTGFKYFINFMQMIDIRLLRSEIFRSDIDLHSKKSISKYENNYRKQFNWKVKFYDYMKYKYTTIIRIYRRAKKQNPKELIEIDNSLLIEQFNFYFSKLQKYHKLFNIEVVQKDIYKFGGKYNRLVTLVMYLHEVEKRFLEKIIV